MNEADRLAAEQRGALKTAGGYAAKGQLGQARNYLYQQGMMEEADKFGQLIRQADADGLAKVDRHNKVLGNLALAADTPEKWAAAVSAAERSGMDVSKFKDFGARDMLLARAGMMSDRIELELKNRALDVKSAGSAGAGGKLGSDQRWRMGPDGQLALDATGRPIAEPIPGSKGEQVPAEVAARIGLADKFAKDVPEIRKDIKAGKLSGPDYYLNRGEAGAILRRIEDGAEALIRNLTGAGMNQTEAEAYAKRFLPGNFDTQATVLEKLRNLEENLTAVRNRVMTGRGISSTDAPAQPQEPAAPAGSADDPLGILGN